MLKRMSPPRPPADPDLRPGLLSIACLLFILLPCLMFTTSLYKLTSLPFDLPARGEGFGAPPPSVIEALEVQIQPDDQGRARLIRVRAAIQTTDVTAMEGSAVWNETDLPAQQGQPDLAGLDTTLDRLHRLDPDYHRVNLVPEGGVSTEQVVAVMDVLRAGGRFGEITLGSPEPGNTGPEPAP